MVTIIAIMIMIIILFLKSPWCDEGKV